MQRGGENTEGVCVHEGHCCNCNGCGAMCGHKMRGYYGRHFIVLVVGVILAFFVGMKLGEMKGWMFSQYGMPMRMYGGWHERSVMVEQPVSTAPIAPTAQ